MDRTIMPNHTLSRLALGLAFAVSCMPLLQAQDHHNGGRRDLQGIWTNGTATPLERPEEFKDRKTFTPGEAAAYEESALDRLLQAIPEIDRIGSDLNYIYLDYHRVLGDRRTSLIVDPPDGRIPALVPEARQRMAGRRLPSSDDPETRTFDDRCIVSQPFGASNAVPPIVPNRFGANYYQIVQTPEYVVILSELLHDARIIRLNGEHLSPSVRPWLGDSIGHWDGDTLVVETTNFSDKTHWQASTRGLRVVERFTRTDADTISYRFTVTDPDTWVSPWTAEIPFKATGQRMFEYACHEGNYALANILRGARFEAGER